MHPERDWRCGLWLAVPGDGGGAHQDSEWAGAQGDGGQVHRHHESHETAGEETQTHHQQVQVSPPSPLLFNWSYLDPVFHANTFIDCSYPYRTIEVTQVQLTSVSVMKCGLQTREFNTEAKLFLRKNKDKVKRLMRSLTQDIFLSTKISDDWAVAMLNQQFNRLAFSYLFCTFDK